MTMDEALDRINDRITWIAGRLDEIIKAQARIEILDVDRVRIARIERTLDAFYGWHIGDSVIDNLIQSREVWRAP